MRCSCGGDLKPNHLLGISKCLREKARPAPRKVRYRVDSWILPGEAPITGTTLRNQRGYKQHRCGNWSRPKDHSSENSLR